MASIWRRASRWMPMMAESMHDDDGRGHSLHPTGGNSTTSDTTYTASTTTATATSGSVGDLQPRDFHAYMAPTMAPVVEEDAEKELDVGKELAEDKMKNLEHIKGLVMEFRGDNHSAVQRWLSELYVGWVVNLVGTHESSGIVVTSSSCQILAETWILALHKIGESIGILRGWYISQRKDQDEGASKQPSSASEFAELVQATVLKMLPFVDIAAAKITLEYVPKKLQVLIDMHGALSLPSATILEEFPDGMIRDLLSSNLTKLDEAICDTIVEMRNNIMAWTWMDDRGSSDIHMVTHTIAMYTKVLWPNYGSVNRILRDAVLHGEFVSEIENVSYFDNLIMQMVSSLERKSSTKSSPDQSLRLLFLINNSYYFLQEFRTISRMDIPLVSLTHKIDDYICSYLHVSWEPVLKCLHDPATPRCFTRYLSLSKFELKLQKTYAAQKLWKVPDPDMRKRLRKAVIDKVVPIFTQFLEDHSIVTPRFFTARNLENMLGELFEG